MDTRYGRSAMKKTICLLAPFCVLFAGLAPGYIWALPLAIGLVAIVGIIFILDLLEA